MSDLAGLIEVFVMETESLTLLLVKVEVTASLAAPVCATNLYLTYIVFEADQTQPVKVAVIPSGTNPVALLDVPPLPGSPTLLIDIDIVPY